MITKPSPLHRDYNRNPNFKALERKNDYNRDPNFKALERKRFINQWSTLGRDFGRLRGNPRYSPKNDVTLQAGCQPIVPLKGLGFRVWGLGIEYGFGYIVIRSLYIPYSIYLRGTTAFWGNGYFQGHLAPCSESSIEIQLL